ncbi:MAG: cobalamin-dependent protein [candidate division NC10 bacterium]|nr:cobalamin-dependent protein [candidate division NC10 bacterium]
MKIVFISPKWERFPHWTYRFPQLGPLTVAGLTPPQHEVQYIDDFVQPIDFDMDADLVAISAMTAQASRGYQIADEFRRRGKRVAIGGIHATLLPEEAKEHADVVVIGEAEGVWKQVLRDIEEGSPQREYRASTIPADFCIGGQFPRRDLAQVEGYTRAFDGDRAMDPLQTTRGCIYDCPHCNVPPVYGRRLRSRPIEDVMAEMEMLEAKNAFIVDNVIYENRTYFMSLMKRLEEIDKKWIGVGTLKMAEDPEFIEGMARSGCAFLHIAFDHLYEDTYESFKKRDLPGHYQEELKIHDIDYGQDYVKLADPYRSAVKRLQDAGIGILGNFAFGFDTDDESIFERTLDFAFSADLVLAHFAILTPYPKSPLHARLLNEGRIFDRDWSHYNGCHVVFEPKQMSAETLQAGWDWAWKRFYGEKTVLRRLCEAFLPKTTRR